MTLRFDDADKLLSLSVGDLVAEGARGGHLSMRLASRSATRLRLGQQVHSDWAHKHSEAEAAYRSEVTLRRQRVVQGWTVTLHGRLDGLVDEDGQRVVEEVKSTVAPAEVLLATTALDWPDYVRQLQTYLWLCSTPKQPPAVGRLVLVSVLDGSHHIVGVPYDPVSTDADISHVLTRILAERERRLHWLSGRRQGTVPLPYASWRPGQQDIADRTLTALSQGRAMLVQAPTGLGKTGPVLWAALSFARAHDLQVFWATARTTHQAVAQDAIARFRQAGLSVRALTVSARAKVCLNDVVACSAERCEYARDYYTKMHDGVALSEARQCGQPDADGLSAIAKAHRACPFELALDASEQVDLLIGDLNYAFEPGVRLSRHFDDSNAKGWIVIADEAHQLVERARGWASPRVSMSAVLSALERLAQLGDEAEPFVEQVQHIRAAIVQAAEDITGPSRDGVGVAELSPRIWQALADDLDAVALDYTRLEAARLARGCAAAAHPDPYIELCRSVMRFADGLAAAGDESVTVVGTGAERSVGLVCLDPSAALGARIGSLAGFVGCSATLSPPDYYTTVLGLGEHTDYLDVSGVFPAEHRSVVVASRVSTAYRDRVQHAPATALLLARCIAVSPGNVALYFPSFAMLEDIVPRLDLPADVELLVQQRASDDASRMAVLLRLAAGGPRVVLAGVLGGVFAEGIDLPAGSLSVVCVIGPGLPPVGLERDLLQQHYDKTVGDGFRFASLIPGLTRVVQAAGRLHRRPEDRGVIVLVGRRFRWRHIAALLPESWQPQSSPEPWADISAFFRGQSEETAG